MVGAALLLLPIAPPLPPQYEVSEEIFEFELTESIFFDDHPISMDRRIFERQGQAGYIDFHPHFC